MASSLVTSSLSLRATFTYAQIVRDRPAHLWLSEGESQGVHQTRSRRSAHGQCLFQSRAKAVQQGFDVSNRRAIDV